MNILILGGTRFQGRFLVQALLDEHHSVTVFHTGRHTIAPRLGLVDLIGNRDNPVHLERLFARKFDVCIDTCAYFPEQVRLARKFITAAQYCLISTVYVYEDHDGGLSESHPTIRPVLIKHKTVTPENYAALKVLCEEEAKACFGQHSLIVRPSIIIGPGDHTERMAFWIRLIAKHRKFLSVCEPSKKVQFVDARDLTEFVVKIVQDAREGPVNVAGDEIEFDDVACELMRLSDHECRTVSVRTDELSAFGLDQLPYFDSVREASYNTDLAESWGFEERAILASLNDIYRHEQKRGFAINNFAVQEAAALKLFA